MQLFVDSHGSERQQKGLHLLLVISEDDVGAHEGLVEPESLYKVSVNSIGTCSRLCQVVARDWASEPEVNSAMVGWVRWDMFCLYRPGSKLMQM